VAEDPTVGAWRLIGRYADGAPVSMTHVCMAAVTGAGVDGAGLTLMAGPTVRETVYATDPLAAYVEELQLTLGEGPCVDTVSTGGPVLASDLCLPLFVARWPAFTPAALDRGCARCSRCRCRLAPFTWVCWTCAGPAPAG
jgi:hypothetical protein